MTQMRREGPVDGFAPLERGWGVGRWTTDRCERQGVHGHPQGSRLQFAQSNEIFVKNTTNLGFHTAHKSAKLTMNTEHCSWCQRYTSNFTAVGTHFVWDNRTTNMNGMSHTLCTISIHQLTNAKQGPKFNYCKEMDVVCQWMFLSNTHIHLQTHTHTHYNCTHTHTHTLTHTHAHAETDRHTNTVKYSHPGDQKLVAV
jgi:hypothetical protein